VQRKLLRVISDDRSFERLAGLGLEIVDVIDADGAEPVPVRLGDEVIVQRSAGSENGLRSGAETGITLIAHAGLRETGELIGLQLFVDQLEQILDLLAKLGCDVRHLQRGLQIAARLSV
jgi:hypothetical protein